eukprot:SAG11_NODE_99_length_16913_cov_41.552813_5_plen_160_part_00
MKWNSFSSEPGQLLVEPDDGALGHLVQALIDKLPACKADGGTTLQKIVRAVKDAIKNATGAVQIPAVVFNDLYENVYLSGASYDELEIEDDPFEKFSIGYEGAFGGTAQFFGGLVELIGEPNKNVGDAIQKEHCDVDLNDRDRPHKISFGASDFVRGSN